MPDAPCNEKTNREFGSADRFDHSAAVVANHGATKNTAAHRFRGLLCDAVLRLAAVTVGTSVNRGAAAIHARALRRPGCEHVLPDRLRAKHDNRLLGRTIDTRRGGRRLGHLSGESDTAEHNSAESEKRLHEKTPYAQKTSRSYMLTTIKPRRTIRCSSNQPFRRT